MQIIPDWRNRITDYSTVALALSAGIVGVWATFPADWLEFLPTAWVARVTGGISRFGLVGKCLVQPGKAPGKPVRSGVI